MGMFGLKLRTNIPCADVIKILRQFDPDASISNLRFKIIHNDFVYVCDCIDEDGIITLLNLLHEFVDGLWLLESEILLEISNRQTTVFSKSADICSGSHRIDHRKPNHGHMDRLHSVG